MALLLVTLNLATALIPLGSATPAGSSPAGLSPGTDAGAVLGAGLRASAPASVVGPSPIGSGLSEMPAEPLALSNGTPQNWTPYAPSAITYGSVTLTGIADTANIGSMPNVSVNQTGNVTLSLNGTWDPGAPMSVDRDWILVVLVQSGRGEVRVLESNASLRLNVGGAQLPFQAFFVLPSPTVALSPSSSAVVSASVPGGNTTSINLTWASAGLVLATAKSLPALPTESVWFNGSGGYSPGGVFAVPMAFATAIPLDGSLPFLIQSGSVSTWTGPSNFSGSRMLLLKSSPVAVGAGAIRVTLWTRGSPESGLYVNSSMTPPTAFRGQNLAIAGSVGNRSLVQSTNWTVNTTAAAPTNRYSENCNALVRLQNGSYRMFCNYHTSGGIGDTEGVDSLLSADGRAWAWEAGSRFGLCGGNHVMTQLAIVRGLDGNLRMYFGGSEKAVTCTLLGSSMHISSAVSNDEGATWTAELETLSDFGVSAPDLRAVVPTADGRLRMYLDSASGLSTALSTDGITWAYESGVTASQPRVMYQLTDGSYKMYFGTTSISSSQSTDGFSWSASQVEVPSWSGNIEAGPLLDLGDGRLRMLIYSQASGLFVATLGNSNTTPASVDALGVGSDGQTFGSVSGSAGAGGAFALNLTLPPAAPIGRFRVAVAAWFGNLALRGMALNRPPVWAGPSTVSAVEDFLLVLNLANWSTDADSADVVVIRANATYGSLNGTNLSLLYPNDVFGEAIQGNLSDGYDLTPFTFDVQVQPVNDPPTLALAASYSIMEDQLSAIDFAGAFADEETASALLNLSTNVSGAAVEGRVIRFNLSLPGNYSVTIGVSDGNTLVIANTVLVVQPVDDAPVLVLQPVYTAQEDSLIVLDFAAGVFDEDTPLAQLVLSTNLSGSNVSGLTASLTRSLPGSIDFNVTVSDGTTAVTKASRLDVVAVNDPPAWVGTPAADNVSEDTPWSLDLSEFVYDEDNGTDSLTFTENSPYAQISGSFLQLYYPEGVLTDSITLTVSDGRSSRSVVVAVSITPVNDAPTVVGSPPSEFSDNRSLVYQFNVSDPDSATGFVFAVWQGPAWITISADGLLNITPPAGLHGRYNYSVIVADAAGNVSAPRNFSISLPANQLPTMAPDFAHLPADAILDTLFAVEFTVADADGDNVTVSWALNVTGQAIDVYRLPTGAWRFEWTPTYPGAHSTPFRAWLNGTLVLNDSFGEARFPFAIRALDPPSRAPVIVGEIEAIVGRPNQTISVNLTKFMSDPDELDTLNLLSWSFEGDVSNFGNYIYDPSTHTITFAFATAGSKVMVFRLSDPSHLEDSQLVQVKSQVDVEAPAATPTPWWWWLVILGGVVGAALAYRRMRAGALGEGPVARAPPGGAPAALPASAGVTPPIAAGPAPTRRAFLVEDLFLLYRDGRTVFTRGGLGADAVEDPESVGAMLVAVQDFVRDSFRKGDPVDRMGYGDNVILLAKGDHVLLAVTVYGEPDREFRDMLIETVSRVEGSYAGVIEQWAGDRADFIGIESILSPLWLLTGDLTRGDVLLATTAREVQMLSGIEFFQGYVRVKVGVVNNSPSVITGVTVDLDYNADVLRLHKIEPATYKAAGPKVNLGVLNTGEKATLAYYFDPQICTSSAIDGSSRYKDSGGQQHVVQMKSRRAEVVCPLFFTKEQANTAMLKRLLETEVKQYDIRAYSFQKGAGDAGMRELFEGLKSAVLAHDVQLVRSFEKRRPYFAEAWFYGKTQVKGYAVIVRAVVDQVKNRAEFFVASTNMRTITGLLAELHHTFHDASAGKFGGLELRALFDENVRGEYSDAGAVSKMVEGEAQAGENDPH